MNVSGNSKGKKIQSSLAVYTRSFLSNNCFFERTDKGIMGKKKCNLTKRDLHNDFFKTYLLKFSK